MTTMRLATRGSALALWQARAVAARLAAVGVTTSIEIVRTAGDRLQTAPPGAGTSGHKRLFVKELEEALLRGDADLAVHSAKDMPADLPDTLAIAACLPREDPRDALVLPAGATAADFTTAMASLGPGTVVGTGSIRRGAQLRGLLAAPTLARVVAPIFAPVFAPIRGNVDTRLRKLDAGEFDALVLACAGLRRLGLEPRITAAIPLDRCVPAPGQGIVAVEVRRDNLALREALGQIDDAAASSALEAERALVVGVGGGCQLPLGGIAVATGDALHVHGVVATPDGLTILHAHATGPVATARALGARVADELVAAGARAILDALR